jgi:hypothetical protein
MGFLYKFAINLTLYSKFSNENNLNSGIPRNKLYILLLYFMTKLINIVNML